MMKTDVSLEIGSEAPQFANLLATDGERYSLSSFERVPVLAVAFLSNGCPNVKGYEERLRAIADEYGPRGVRLVGINSNNPYISPRDAYPEMVARASASQFNFPYLKDEDQSVAGGYGAVCTPHVFVFDEARRLRYRGRVDDSRLPTSVTSHDLRNALEDLLARRPVRVPETEPFGCSIVW